MKKLPTLATQIAARCVHFTGIASSSACKAGVCYDSVRDTSQRPYSWPCISPSPFGGIVAKTTCALKQLPTAEQVETELAEWQRLMAEPDAKEQR